MGGIAVRAKDGTIGILALLVALWLVPSAVGAATEGVFEKSLSVSGTVDLDVTTGAGNIRVFNGKPGTVWIKGTIHARDHGGMSGAEKVRYLQSHLPIEQTGGSIRIGRIENREVAQNVSISYEIEVPAETRLVSKTGSGNQSVDGLRGSAEVSTGSGNIAVSNAGDQVRASTGSGDIELNNISSSVQASTGSGSIAEAPALT